MGFLAAIFGLPVWARDITGIAWEWKKKRFTKNPQALSSPRRALLFARGLFTLDSNQGYR